jgi:hypothetical protein
VLLDDPLGDAGKVQPQAEDHDARDHPARRHQEL